MYKFLHLMPNFWRTAVAAALVTLIAACGGGGGGTALPIASKVLVEDAAIVGAAVTDSLNRQAEYTGRGEYKFLYPSGQEFVPCLPITVSSRNIFVNGVVEGIPLTFQDMDRNGVFTPSVDIAYNGSFSVRYAIPGATTIYANPVAALIPPNWDGSASIAGLSSTILRSSTNSSVETTGSAQLKQATALLTALSDTLGSTLSSNGMENSKVSSTLASLLVAVGTTTGVNLLSADANAATQLGVAAASTVTAAASSIPAGNLTAATSSASNLGTNLQNLSLVVGNTVTNYEALVQMAQNSESLSTNSFDVQTSATETKRVDLDIQNKRAVLVNTLILVPFCDLVSGQTGECSSAANSGDWLAFGRLTGFGAAAALDGSINVSGSGALFNSFSFPTSLNAKYESSSGSWKYTGPGASLLQIFLGVSFSDPTATTQTGNMMRICNSQGSCVPYYLAAPAGVCNFVTTNSVVDRSRLANINALNVQQTTCP